MFMWKLGLVTVAFVLGLASVECENSRSYVDKCPKFQIRRSTIIKTQQSVRNGAEFLGKKIMSSARGCHELCCKKDGCNLVMLKYDTESFEKKVSCFMFNCRSPSVCNFYKHSSYHSYAALEFEDRKSQWHSSEHQSKDSEFKEPNTFTEITTEAPAPTATKTRKPYKRGTWFYSTSKPKHLWLDEQKIDRLSTTHQSDREGTHAPNSSFPKSTEDYSKYGSYDHSKDVDSNEKKTMDSRIQTTAAVDEDEDFPRRVFVDNNPDFPDEPQRNPKTTTASSGGKIPVTRPRTTKGSFLRTTKGTARIPATKSHVSNVVIKRLNIQENKAVIPLAIGLVLALLLLLGIIFRLKTSRRRRTKAFLTDDADYLINGMYL
ncbi:uncharacterized protein LOC114525597 [Dendronephthya gigantea]|uniref:uncharacterized protein LOC114525597 n=1 Tax=Dendronephthya gigantea TaxID=151771 RepID=UPI00106B957E|nr:uncharacterized protein LOC114525597 [Dendronephthya gigantea]